MNILLDAIPDHLVKTTRSNRSVNPGSVGWLTFTRFVCGRANALWLITFVDERTVSENKPLMGE
jgi:hypothetical protein